LCAMSYRFNSFYKEEMHPFIDAMVNFLKVGGSKARRPNAMAAFFRAEDQQFDQGIQYMRNLSADLVKQRRENPTETKDLMNAMINGKDPKTGESLTEDSIIDNMITFLIAGHETTSGLLVSTSLFYQLHRTFANKLRRVSFGTTCSNLPKHTERLSKRSTL
jgi:cytochrome P450/NADPH-cytochrome P450 reductase